MKKPLLLLLALTTTSITFSQTFITGGPIEGTSTNHVRITASEYDGYGIHFFAGTFVGSVDIDYTSGVNVLTTTSASNKAAFLASDDWGSNFTGLMFEGTGIGDSLQINTIYIDGSGYIYIGGSVYGTVDMDPSGSTFNLTSNNGADAFFAKYSPGGTFTYASLLTNPGNTATIVKILPTVFAPSEITVFGYFDGTIDLDPTGAQNLNNSLGPVNSFHASYDDATGLSLLNSRMILGNGNVHIADAENDYYLGRMNIIGSFDIDVDVDPSGNNIVLTSFGSSDIFYGQYDYQGNIYQYMQLGSTGTDRGVDVNIMHDELYLMAEFSGVMAVDPYGGSGTQAVSNGSLDVVVAKYNMLGLVMDWRRTFGNAGSNNGSFARCSFSEMFMPQIAPEESGTRGGPMYVLSYVFGMDFSGTMDADPTAGTANITSSGAARNGVVIELDSAGNYYTNYHNEGIRVVDFYSSYNNTHAAITGEFIGTNIDLMPYDSVFLATHTTNRAGYINVFDRCLLQATVELAHVYPCGTCEADLICNVTGAVGPIDAYWGGGVNGLVANDMCPGTYSCEVYDFHHCYQEPFIDILEHAAGAELDGNIVTTPSSCGNSYGNATASAVNGIGLIKYLWSDGTMIAFNDSLPAGVYNVQISDSLGCYVTETVVINDVDGPSVTLNTTVDPTCAGATTGSIDVTVTGGAAPVTFLWSNGATTEDLVNVGAGTYAFIATDANGCQTQLCVDLTQPQPMTLSNAIISNSDCNTANGSMAVIPNGGSLPYTFQWGATSGNQTNDTITGVTGGIHTITVTDAQGCSTTSWFGLNDNSGTSLSLSWGYAPSCLFGPGYIDVFTFGADFPYNYLWNTGDVTEDITLLEGGKFVLAATGVSGCVSTFEYTFDQVLPASPVVCMVTVDSTSTKNVVIWDKTASVDAVYFNIYREGFCDNTAFGHVGTVDGDSLSLFYDTVVNTDLRNWQYYVTAVDSCGYESLPSEIHRTIHLAGFYDSNNQIRLQWDDYIGEVTTQYNIFRKHAVTGLFTQIDSTPGTSVWALDTSDLSSYGNGPIEYYIEAVPVNMCYASRAFNQNDSRSNRVTIMAPVMDTSGVQEIFNNPLIQVYPNPTNDVLNINIQGSMGTFQVDMINSIGQTLKTISVNKHGSISTRDLGAGMYFVRVRENNKPAQVIKVLVTK